MKLKNKYFSFLVRVFIALFFINTAALASEKKTNSLLNDLSTLGDNQFLKPYIKSTSTSSEISVVQNRFYSRFNRQELLTGIGYSTSGPAYFKTTATSMFYKFYVSPKWSVGVNYSYFTNSLSSAGIQVIKNGEAKLKNDPDFAFIPDMDYPKFSYAATASWYPSYGKLNLFNTIMYFDLFVTSGLGKIILKHKPSSLLFLSFGSSLWLTKKWIARFEMQNKLYKETWYNSQHNIVTTQMMLSAGYMF